MTRIKATVNDWIIVKHILNCGLYKPKEKCKQLCNHLQNMVRKPPLLTYEVICLVELQNYLFWPYFVNNCKVVCTFPLVYINHNSKCVLRLFGRWMSHLFVSLRYTSLPFCFSIKSPKLFTRSVGKRGGGRASIFSDPHNQILSVKPKMRWKQFTRLLKNICKKKKGLSHYWNCLLKVPPPTRSWGSSAFF